MEKIKTKDLRELETRLESRLRTVEIRWCTRANTWPSVNCRWSNRNQPVPARASLRIVWLGRPDYDRSNGTGIPKCFQAVASGRKRVIVRNARIWNKVNKCFVYRVYASRYEIDNGCFLVAYIEILLSENGLKNGLDRLVFGIVLFLQYSGFDDLRNYTEIGSLYILYKLFVENESLL